MRAWADVATLTRAKRSKGRFAVRAAAGLPFVLEPGCEVAFVPPVLDACRRTRVVEVGPLFDDTAEVAFAHIDTMEAARPLVGAHVLVRRGVLDAAQASHPLAPASGWGVVDDRWGFLGRVRGVVAGPGQDLIEVERAGSEALPDANAQTLLIPLVDEIVRNVDPDAGVVLVSVPDGLLDL